MTHFITSHILAWILWRRKMMSLLFLLQTQLWLAQWHVEICSQATFTPSLFVLTHLCDLAVSLFYISLLVHSLILISVHISAGCLSPSSFCSASDLSHCPAAFIHHRSSLFFSSFNNHYLSLPLSEPLSLSRRQGKGRLGENERKRGKENAAVITLSLHLRKAKYLNYKRVKEEARRVEEMTRLRRKRVNGKWENY